MSLKLFWEADLKADQIAKGTHPWHILTKTEITLAWIQTEKSLKCHWGSMEQLIAATLNQENCQLWLYQGFPGGSDGKEITFNAGKLDSMPGSRKIPPEKGMATHSSVLAWRIPCTEEPGRLHPVHGSQRVDNTEWLSLSVEWRTLRTNQEHQLKDRVGVGAGRKNKNCFSEIPEAQGETGG